MLSGIDGSNASFLANLNQIENNINQTNQQITSGVRVSEASDDPADIGPILDIQNQIDQITQTQTNLTSANTDAQTADGALQTASNLMDQLITLGTEGANATTTATTSASLAQQVQQIQQQLVSIANTMVGNRYIFGGDDPSTQPYTYNWSNPEGVVQNNTAGNTRTIADSNGNTIVPGMTAQQIFDQQLPNNGGPASNNVFQAVYSLGQALLNNDQAGAATAVASIQTAATQIEQATAQYGNTEDWIQQANQTASSQLTNLQTQLSGLRDTDVAAAATQLSTEQTALQAALSAQSSISNKTLFSYLG